MKQLLSLTQARQQAKEDITPLEEIRKLRLFNAIKKSEPFKYDEGLTFETFREIYPKVKYESFLKGQTVFSHGITTISSSIVGDYGEKFYVVVSGKLEVWIPRRNPYYVSKCNL